MKITIRQPLAFSEIGRKDNQEDSLYPDPAVVGLSQRVFLMCDGMGGHEHGEVASQTVASVMGNTLENALDMDSLKAFEFALSRAYDELDSVDIEKDGKKMGTTMTCLCLTSQGALMAHIGDSRIYHVRPSWYDASSGRKGIKNVTSDHSLVNDLLKAGELTPDEAQNYPHKNIITRAMQPHQERRAKADINVELDVQAGDYFFLCCDGVLEQLTDSRLCEILAMPIADRDKMALIKLECDGKTKDNYTAWLIPIECVEQDASNSLMTPKEDIIQAIAEDTADSNTRETFEQNSNDTEDDINESGPLLSMKRLQKLLSQRILFFILSIVLVLGACSFYIHHHSAKPPKHDETVKNGSKDSLHQIEDKKTSVTDNVHPPINDISHKEEKELDSDNQ